MPTSTEEQLATGPWLVVRVRAVGTTEGAADAAGASRTLVTNRTLAIPAHDSDDGAAAYGAPGMSNSARSTTVVDVRREGPFERVRETNVIRFDDSMPQGFATREGFQVQAFALWCRPDVIPKRASSSSAEPNRGPLDHPEGSVDGAFSVFLNGSFRGSRAPAEWFGLGFGHGSRLNTTHEDVRNKTFLDRSSGKERTARVPTTSRGPDIDATPPRRPPPRPRRGVLAILRVNREGGNNGRDEGRALRRRHHTA